MCRTLEQVPLCRLFQAPLLHLQLGCASLEPLGLGLTLHNLILIWSPVPDPPYFPVDHRSPIHELLGIMEDLHSQVGDPLPFRSHLHLARNTCNGRVPHVPANSPASPNSLCSPSPSPSSQAHSCLAPDDFSQ